MSARMIFVDERDIALVRVAGNHKRARRRVELRQSCQMLMKFFPIRQILFLSRNQRGNTAQLRSLEEFAHLQRVGILEEKHIIARNAFNQGTGPGKLAKNLLVMVPIVQNVEQLGIEWM